MIRAPKLPRCNTRSDYYLDPGRLRYYIIRQK